MRSPRKASGNFRLVGLAEFSVGKTVLGHRLPGRVERGRLADAFCDLSGQGIGFAHGGSCLAEMEAKTGDKRTKKSGFGRALHDGKNPAGIDGAGQPDGKMDEEAEGVPAGFGAGEKGFEFGEKVFVGRARNHERRGVKWVWMLGHSGLKSI